MKSIRLFGGYFAAVAAVSILTFTSGASAMENKKVEPQKLDAKTEVKAQPEKKMESTKKESKSDKMMSDTKYTYVANYGDTYIQIVRKAVQTYGILNNKDLGNARIVAIETQVAKEHGFPYINQGQKISFAESDIKAWVDKAMKMPADQIAAWQTYVPYVNFNTDHIAEK